MKDLTVRQLEDYLLDHYQQSRTEEGLFIKLVEEVGERDNDSLIMKNIHGFSCKKKARPCPAFLIFRQ